MLTAPSVVFIAMLSANTLTPTPILELNPVSGASDFFLQQPLDISIDDKGQIYVVDTVAKTVFYWDRKGQFLGTIGKAGQGPGEFQFSSMAGPQAYLSVRNNNLLVFDGGSGLVNIFKEGQFAGSVKAMVPPGRTEYFKVTPDGQYLVYQQKWGNTPKRDVELYDDQGNLSKSILSTSENTYKARASKDGGFGGLNVNAYSPRLTVHYSPETGQILAGTGESPSFEIYDLKGKLISKVSLKLLQKEINSEDEAEYKRVRWISDGLKNGYVRLSFPEKKPFYTHLLPLKGKGVLVFSRSPNEAHIEGILVNDLGETLSNFKFTCGQGGNLYSTNGRIFVIMLNEDEDFAIRELNFKQTGS